MTYFFLKKDYDHLEGLITQITRQIREVGQEMGASCQEGAETYHDNFAFEDGERIQIMLSKRLQSLRRIKGQARVVTPDARASHVAMGRLVTVKDLETDRRKTFRIGSYMVLDDSTTISYLAPLARIVMGATIGDIREGTIQGREVALEIVNIS